MRCRHNPQATQSLQVGERRGAGDRRASPPTITGEPMKRAPPGSPAPTARQCASPRLAMPRHHRKAAVVERGAPTRSRTWTLSPASEPRRAAGPRPSGHAATRRTDHRAVTIVTIVACVAHHRCDRRRRCAIAGGEADAASATAAAPSPTAVARAADDGCSPRRVRGRASRGRAGDGLPVSYYAVTRDGRPITITAARAHDDASIAR